LASSAEVMTFEVMHYKRVKKFFSHHKVYGYLKTLNFK
jgi:hypothetical protein